MTQFAKSRTAEPEGRRPAPWMEVRSLSKSFGGARALEAVDMDIYRGEVHGLVGANGAGKSTLVRSLAGIVLPDSGSVRINGAETRIASPRDSEALKLAFIHQELNLVPHFSALQNILLGVRKKTHFGIIDWRASSRAASAAAKRIGAEFSLDRRVDELSVGERWLVMISKALVQDAALIGMDEPTASLSDNEAHHLFGVVRDLASSGVAVLYVSHRLDEVLDLSDRITVFRDGRVTDTAVRGGVDKPGLIRAIVGRNLESRQASAKREADDRVPVFEVKHVSRANAVRDVSFRVYAGEVLGLGGLVGAGRTEVARLAFGADKIDAGEFELLGKPLPGGSVSNHVARGVGMVPEERRSQGLILEKSVLYNMNIAALRSLRVAPFIPIVSRKKARVRAESLARQLQIKAPTLGVPARSLSGGNQQKVVIARWLSPDIKVVFFDEPSRGVDIGARQEIHDAIRHLARSGIGTIVISSDVEELAVLCDRVIVMAEGQVVGELLGKEISEDHIIELSYGAGQKQELSA